MKKCFCCIALPSLFILSNVLIGFYLLFFYFSIEIQIEKQGIGANALIFGTIQDSVQIPLVANAYLVNDGQESVWVTSREQLPQTKHHVLVEGKIQSGLKIPGHLGGGKLLVHLQEVRRWDFPI